MQPSLNQRIDPQLFLAHEAAVHTAKLRIELSQSRTEQQEYLQNVELARVLDKRAERKQERGEEMEMQENNRPRKRPKRDREEKPVTVAGNLDSVLGRMF